MVENGCRAQTGCHQVMLPKARFIWSLSGPVTFGFAPRSISVDEELQLKLERLREHLSETEQSFKRLQFLHLDFCPRLMYVLPLPLSKVDSGYFRGLVTLEIMWCGDLKEVFPVYIDTASTSGITQVDFESLKRIHLQELPKLQSICGDLYRIKAPLLETVKIKGCWSLKRLPASREYEVFNTKIECECEKE